MSSHKDRVSALATTTLDLGNKLDEVVHGQRQHGEVLARNTVSLSEHGATLTDHATTQRS